jgi:hypothetical protein
MNLRIFEIDKSLVLQTAAYLGSIVVHNLNGSWHKTSGAIEEPFVVYHSGERRRIAYPYADVVEMMLEGEIYLTDWYRSLLD